MSAYTPDVHIFRLSPYTVRVSVWYRPRICRNAATQNYLGTYIKDLLRIKIGH